MYLCTLKMNDMDILELALHNQQTAWKILEHTGIIPAWERIGATVHLVGSLKSGLLAKSRDIDLHIYTDTLDIAASFSVMQELAERLSLKEIQFKNLIQTEEECIEWHVLYEDEDRNTWKFDMIHIRKGSKYDGVVEKVRSQCDGEAEHTDGRTCDAARCADLNEQEADDRTCT